MLVLEQHLVVRLLNKLVETVEIALDLVGPLLAVVEEDPGPYQLA
jgi:hypothetical protein